MSEWRKPYKHQFLEFEDFNVYPCECLTIWANTKGRNEERQATQIEIRIAPDGRVEIFIEPSRVRILDFEQWQPTPLPLPPEPPA